MWAKQLLALALKSFPKYNKSPNLVTLPAIFKKNIEYDLTKCRDSIWFEMSWRRRSRIYLTQIFGFRRTVRKMEKNVSVENKKSFFFLPQASDDE